MKGIYWTILLFALGRAMPAQSQCLPADNCAEANCIFDAVILSSNTWTNAGATGDGAAGFCGTIEGNIWFPVLADSTGNVQITVTSTNCEVANGLQIALYEDCFAAGPLACNGGSAGGGDVPLNLSATLNPGQLFFLMVDGYAGDVCDFTINTIGLADPEEYGQITGTVRIDENLNCETDSMDTPALGIPVSLSGLYSALRPTDSLGQFHFFYTDTGAVTIALNGFPNNLWALCADSFVVNPPFFPDSTHVDFLLQPLTYCADMSVDLSLPPFFRPCQSVDAVVNYCNQGTATAQDAVVALEVPSILNLTGSSLPVSGQSGDTLFFALGNVAPLHCGSFQITLQLPCNGSLVGQTLCLEAHIYPDSLCLPAPNWSGAHVNLSARCIGNAQVEFTLKNTGMAPMAEMQEYIIIEDEVVLRSGNFQLNPGESMLVQELANGATWRMEAGQEVNHPGFSQPAVSLEGCGGLSSGFVTAFSTDDADDFIDIECRLVVGSYDPNIKIAVPSGVGPQQLIRPNTPLEYTIHFQNTGTDTAFVVRLVDVLPAALDPATFRPGASSHPCRWQIFGTDTLEVVFDPIVLPDSNVNERASHGWFEFEIAQKPDLPNGTLLENRAAIYFDYNDPVLTDPAWHTVGALTVRLDNPSEQTTGWKVLGNPAVETATFLATAQVHGVTRFELYDTQGRLLRQELFSGGQYVFQRQSLTGGMYVFRLISERGATVSGKIAIPNQ